MHIRQKAKDVINTHFEDHNWSVNIIEHTNVNAE